MIQDIAPKEFDNQYKNIDVDDMAYVIYACGNQVLLQEKKGELSVPKRRELGSRPFPCIYLFSIDGQPIFMPYIQNRDIEKEMVDYWQEKSGYRLYRLNGSGIYTPKWLYFVCGTAIQLNRWYHNNRFCGACGEYLVHGEKERVLRCPCCENIVYPKISPAVIVGVIHEDKILMTKYADRRDGTRYSLIAGFAEVGESIEETVRREVMEEVGVSVKNLKYYKSQPWPFSDTLLLGFFCELDGSGEIRLDGIELSEAEWVARNDMKMKDDGISLTYEMMDYFKNQWEAF